MTNLEESFPFYVLGVSIKEKKIHNLIAKFMSFLIKFKHFYSPFFLLFRVLNRRIRKKKHLKFALNCLLNKIIFEPTDYFKFYFFDSKFGQIYDFTLKWRTFAVHEWKRDSLKYYNREKKMKPYMIILCLLPLYIFYGRIEIVCLLELCIGYRPVFFFSSLVFQR